jgi:hypothetical protein
MALGTWTRMRAQTVGKRVNGVEEGARSGMVDLAVGSDGLGSDMDWAARLWLATREEIAGGQSSMTVICGGIIQQGRWV